jgi:protein-disulfide isomerase-like protein with CxxC motif
MKNSIHYFFDPLCEWCHGFSPMILRAFENYGDKIGFQIHTCGGLDPADKLIPSSSVNAFRRLNPSLVFHYAAALQRSYFNEGLDLSRDATYVKLGKEFDLDIGKFLHLIHSYDVVKETKAELQYAKTLNVDEFPCLFEEMRQRLLSFAGAYTPWSILENTFKAMV